METNQDFIWSAEVRDYEIDLQGVVNNANYLHYFEHARHKHLERFGIHFQDLHLAGYDLVLIKTEISYHQSLRSGDVFNVTSKVAKNSRIKFKFTHELYKLPQNTLVARSENIVACIATQTQKPCLPDFLKVKLQLMENS